MISIENARRKDRNGGNEGQKCAIKIVKNPTFTLMLLITLEKLTSMATQQYSLRRRPHDTEMPDHTGHLADKNFLIRLLYKDSYWLLLYCNSVLSVSICVLSYVNKEMIAWLLDRLRLCLRLLIFPPLVEGVAIDTINNDIYGCVQWACPHLLFCYYCRRNRCSCLYTACSYT